MPVHIERVGGGVVAHPALKPQWRKTTLDQERGACVAKCVKADLGKTCTPQRWRQHPVASVVGVEGSTMRPAKDEVFLACVDA
jgi:hypothetical protein